MIDPITPGGTRGGWRPSSRTLARAAMLAVLLIGVLVGVALDRVALRQPLDPRSRSGLFGLLSTRDQRRIDERIARELDLSPAQRVRVDSIIARRIRDIAQVRQEVHPRMRQIFTATRAEIDSVLTPAQRERLQKLYPPRQHGGGRAAADSTR